MINKERSLFSKLVGSLILFLLPVFILSIYSNRVNENAMTEQIKQSSISRLSTLATQLDNTILQLEVFTNILIRDPNVIEFQDLSLVTSSYYEQINRKKIIQDKLYLQSASTEWINDVTVYSPQTGQTISTVNGTSFDPERLQRLSKENWNFILNDEQTNKLGKVTHLTVEPYEAGGGISKANSIIEISFDMSNVIHMLDKFKSQGSGEALFYKSSDTFLATSSFPSYLLSEAVSALKQRQLADEGGITLNINGISYLLTYSNVQALDGYVVSVVPLSEILTPLRMTNRFAYLVYGLLLIVGIAVSWLLYRNVQVPLRALVKGVQQIKMGQYKTRIPLQVNNEFRLIISRFNDMADQIQQLIENVLEQQLHTREAELKQLQSQINPHFLYNSLTYVISMTKLNRKDAVLEMAYHLSDYYRYTTRVENQLVKLEDELKNAADYLSIHRMRMSRIRYGIDVLSGMMTLIVPRLILQPIVENALIHGVEALEDVGVITITGRCTGNEYSLIVEDNGGSMNFERLQDLRKLLTSRHGEGAESCGLLNVHRRLQLRYGADSGLKLSINAASGLRVELHWRGEAVDDEAVDCR
ncbi:sensor histidine kinase [Paenibacillus sp. KS-LC4]|uniref:cache domain-containing sensor histidine kinase n=1 Tax=Paenibacillus sp. KS-LC4 TaxID=2979727 RepID=UPI0030CDC728